MLELTFSLLDLRVDLYHIKILNSWTSRESWIPSKESFELYHSSKYIFTCSYYLFYTSRLEILTLGRSIPELVLLWTLHSLFDGWGSWIYGSYWYLMRHTKVVGRVRRHFPSLLFHYLWYTISCQNKKAFMLRNEFFFNKKSSIVCIAAEFSDFLTLFAHTSSHFFHSPFIFVTLCGLVAGQNKLWFAVKVL